MIGSEAYQNNTGSFAEADPFRIARRPSLSSIPHYYTLSSCFSRISFYYRSCVSSLPLPAFLKGGSHAYAAIALDDMDAHSRANLAEDEFAMDADTDMQALLKNV